MLTRYVDEAMRRAQYEIMEDGEFWGEIPGFFGVWGSAANLEDCREDLRGALEGWLILKLWDHDEDIPVLGKRLSLYPRPSKIGRKVESPAPSRNRKAS